MVGPVGGPLAIARGVSLLLAVAVMITLSVTGGSAAEPTGGARSPTGSIPSRWGWVTARQPATAMYAPAAKDQGSAAGDTATVERTGRGRYIVRFGGLSAGSCGVGGCSGTALVTPLSGQQRRCHVVELGSGLPVTLIVTCTDRTGRRADSAFSANFLAAGDETGPLAYLWADDPTSDSSIPDPDYSFNSGPKDNAIWRLGPGFYQVALPDQYAGSRGNVQVNGMGAACRVADRDDNDDPKDIYASVFVRCLDQLRQPADARFFLAFTDQGGLKGMSGTPAAYLFANSPTATAYKPAAVFRYSSAGQAPRVARAGVGRYLVTLDGMPLGGSAQVTSYGLGKAECQLSGLRKTGVPQRIGVRCYRPDGDLADGRFYLTFTK